MRVVEGRATVDDVDAFLSWLDGIADDYCVTVQAFDARYVVGRPHLERAVSLADRAIDRGENVARDRGVEILLYAAGRRQIDRALTMGVGEGEGPVVVLVDAGDAGRERLAADAVRERLDPAECLDAVDADRVRDFFDVTDAELAATNGGLADIVLERVALLDVEK
jgi:KEOPS complex subunit Cgi121